MIPKMFKVRMAAEAVTSKATEPQNSFDAFIALCAVIYYFWTHKKKSFIALISGAISTISAIYYLIERFVFHHIH